ncbi:hypothetical protein Tco_1194620, partial [Tanacetum coccineum]
DGDGVVMVRSLSTSAPGGRDMEVWGRTVWICQILQEISQKRTRERMSDQEAKELKAEAREIMPQPSTEREEMEGQDEEKKDREEGWELKFRAWSTLLEFGWQLRHKRVRAVVTYRLV